MSAKQRGTASRAWRGRCLGRHHHLQRMEHRGFEGWVARITRGARLVCFEYFSDLRDGGRKRALAKAIAYRDRMLRALPPPVLTKLTHSRNSTGMVGLHVVRRRGRGGALLSYYVGTWVWPARSRHQRTKYFSVQKYGKRKARALAVEARLDALRRTAEEERRLLLEELQREQR